MLMKGCVGVKATLAPMWQREWTFSYRRTVASNLAGRRVRRVIHSDEMPRLVYAEPSRLLAA